MHVLIIYTYKYCTHLIQKQIVINSQSLHVNFSFSDAVIVLLLWLRNAKNTYGGS